MAIKQADFKGVTRWFFQRKSRGPGNAVSKSPKEFHLEFPFFFFFCISARLVIPARCCWRGAKGEPKKSSRIRRGKRAFMRSWFAIPSKLDGDSISRFLLRRRRRIVAATARKSRLPRGSIVK